MKLNYAKTIEKWGICLLYTSDISREILQRETITFIFQPFIENAMYHGLEPKIGKGKISLRGWQEQNNMIFTIEDDGVGIDDMSRLENGYGVRNVCLLYTSYTDWEEESIRKGFEEKESMFFILTNSRSFSVEETTTVSYTHLDVYKRQHYSRSKAWRSDIGTFRR